MLLRDTSRQQVLLDALASHVHDSPNIGALVLVGSFANGTADAVSDLDLFFITYDDHFEDSWARRHDLHLTGALVHWDQQDQERPEVAGHRWVTPDLVVVECVVSSPQGGARLASPFKFYAGAEALVDGFPKREPIDRSDMTDEDTHPIDIVYDVFKKAVREAAAGER